MSTISPIIDLTDQPVVESIDDSKTLQTGASLFLQHGFLVIKNAFERDFILKAHDHFLSSYADLFGDTSREATLKVGDKRIMIPVHLEGVFHSPDYYANPKVMPLLRYLLGDDLILNSLGSVVSLPGSDDQHVHRDHPNIYNSWRGYRWSEKQTRISMPPYAVTMGIPLVDLNEQTGNTRYWPGTHLSAVEPEDLPTNSGVDLYTQIGACILFDYRIIHAGVANKSSAVRPLLYNVYAQPWFRDSKNYRTLDALPVTKAQIQSVPASLQPLFDWVLSAKERAELADGPP